MKRIDGRARLALGVVLFSFAFAMVAAAGAQETKRLAVLDFRNPAAIADQEVVYITDVLRNAARQALPAGDYYVMTRDNVVVALPKGKQIEKCLDTQCIVETGQQIGAQYIVDGQVVRFGGELRVSFTLYETLTGNLLATKLVGGKTVLDLERPLMTAASEIFGVLPGVRAAQGPTTRTQTPPVVIQSSAPSTTADPEFEKLVRAELARIEAQKRVEAENKARLELEADYRAVRAILENDGYSAEAKKAAYQVFVTKWAQDPVHRPEVEGWLRSVSAPEVFVLIQPGTFRMGCEPGDSDCYPDESPRHPVTLTRPFYLGKTEVTQGQWKKVMGNNPSAFSSCGDDCPVEQVSWTDAVEFCNRLSDQEGLGRCYSGTGSAITWDRSCTGYRLPTEAEWEYAARGGREDEARPGSVGDVTWYSRNAGNQTHRVAQKQANRYRLNDMLGNVSEWVWDWYGSYPSASARDPQGPIEGSNRVIRGGGWFSGAQSCRSACRDSNGPGNGASLYGFRLARTAK